MEINNWKNPTPCVAASDEIGIELEFRMGNRSVSDFLIEPDDIIELYKAFRDWVSEYRPSEK